MRKGTLDSIDLQIIKMLQEDARTSLKEVASAVYISSPAVSTRIERLKDEGFIKGFHAFVDPEMLGYHIKAFISVDVSTEDKPAFVDFVEKCSNVIECNCVTGEYSMILEVLFKRTVDLDSFIGQLGKFGKTKTDIVFSIFIECRNIHAEG